MKFSAVALFVAAGVSAEAVFKVSEFSAECIPHSSQCSYSFTVIQPGTMETTGVKCSAMVTSDNTLPEVKDAACEQSSRTFSVTKDAGGLTLTVTQPVTPSSNQSGSHAITSDQLTTSSDPVTPVQSYTGPKDFDLE